MADSVIDAMITELEAAKDTFPAPTRGLDDFQKLTLNAPQAVVDEAKAKLVSAAQFDAERAKQIDQAIGILKGLKQHGYPEHRPFEVSDEVADLLDKELAELQKARQRFAKKGSATTGSVAFAPTDEP